MLRMIRSTNIPSKEIASLTHFYDEKDGNWVGASENNGFPVRMNGGLTSFGEISSAENNPFVQSIPAYNFLPSNFRAYTASSGDAGISNGEFYASTITGFGSYGAIQSFRSLNAKAGDSSLLRLGARFSTGVENTWVGAGGVNVGDELSFGMSGLYFGIWHRYGGKEEVRELSISSGAGGSEAATVTIDGNAFLIPITNGTQEHNAKEIADFLTTGTSSYGAWQNDRSVIVNSLSDGPKTGSYSFSSSSAVGSWATVTTGVAKTSEFIEQSDWNVNTMTGLDPTMGNVYQISFTNIGYGPKTFSVIDPDDGVMKKVHVIQYQNRHVTPALSNPSLRLGIYAVNLASDQNVFVYSSAMAGYSQGQRGKIRNPRSYSNTITSADSTNYYNVLTIRNRAIMNGLPNQIEIKPVFISVANDGNKNATVKILTNATVSGDTDYQYIRENSQVAEVDTAGTTVDVTSGTELMSFAIGPASSELIDLTPILIFEKIIRKKLLTKRQHMV